MFNKTTDEFVGSCLPLGGSVESIIIHSSLRVPVLVDVMCDNGDCVYSGVQYMEKEDAVNVLQFWLAADNFQDQLAAKKGQYDGQEAQNDAMILYDK